MQEEDALKEKRRHERTPTNVSARYRSLENLDFSSGIIKNVSETGMLLQGEKPADEQDSIQLLALESADSEMFQATARVAWCSGKAKELKADDIIDSFLLGLEVIHKTPV